MALRAGVALSALADVQPSLEEVFLRLTRTEAEAAA